MNNWFHPKISRSTWCPTPPVASHGAAVHDPQGLPRIGGRRVGAVRHGQVIHQQQVPGLGVRHGGFSKKKKHQVEEKQ